jgi:hypothetical protein
MLSTRAAQGTYKKNGKIISLYSINEMYTTTQGYNFYFNGINIDRVANQCKEGWILKRNELCLLPSG